MRTERAGWLPVRIEGLDPLSTRGCLLPPLHRPRGRSNEEQIHCVETPGIHRDAIIEAIPTACG
jgi:hypothetical protein